MPTRRDLLRTIERLGVLGVAARTGILSAAAQNVPLFADPKPFSDDFVQGVAHELAAKPFQEEKIELPPPLQNLTYEQYRDIRFNPEKSIWRGEPHGFSFDLFHPGFYYTSPVDIYVVTGNQQTKLNYVPDLFTFGTLVQKPSGEADLHYSGFRLRYPINTKDVLDEFLVFLGASYFRAIGKGQIYGLSARGLAIDTGQPKGEEFPFFRSFWIKTPEADSKTVVIHALLNSQSATGAFRFTVKPGDSTLMDVEMTLYPRRDIDHAGIGALTSMYLFGTLNKDGFDDYRLAVHDSDGLFMVNGREEWIWRPLANPTTLQVSAFQDRSPRGFGLMQRKHKYQDFLDLDLKYERRPSLWVEPIGDWGAGWVELYEIPSQLEIHDNIVAFWRPEQVLTQGSQASFIYRLSWCREWPEEGQSPKALARFSGGGLNPEHKRHLFVIDFEGGILSGEIKPEVAVTQGAVSNVILQPNSETGGLRLSFEVDLADVELSELRAVLTRGSDPVSETWVYRWTQS
jgi:periplasmic glucans biosynthesis protein